MCATRSKLVLDPNCELWRCPFSKDHVVSSFVGLFALIDCSSAETHWFTIPFLCSFQINYKTGEITVRECDTPGLRPCLDYEWRRDVRLRVTARDKCGEGLRANTTVTVLVGDGNDNPPKFLLPVYFGTIDEGETDPRITVQVSLDGKSPKCAPNCFSSKLSLVLQSAPNLEPCVCASSQNVFVLAAHRRRILTREIRFATRSAAATPEACGPSGPWTARSSLGDPSTTK